MKEVYIMNIINEVLIRLKDVNNEHSMLSAFYTNNPSEYLKMYNFCKKNDIPLSLYDKDIQGSIEDIKVFFGGGENIPCIDIWIDVWG